VVYRKPEPGRGRGMGYDQSGRGARDNRTNVNRARGCLETDPRNTAVFYRLDKHPRANRGKSIMRKCGWLMILPMLVPVAESRLVAQVQTQAQVQAAQPDAELKQLIARYDQAFNAGDAAAVAALFTADARVYDPDGVLLEGADAIRRRFAQVFENEPGLQVKSTVDELRLITPDVAVETGQTIITTKQGVSRTNRYHALHAKRNQHWQTVEAREFSAPDLPANADQRLAGLEWLLGDWLDEGPNGVARYSGAWDNAQRKRFLVRPFTVQVQGKPTLTGNHRIGFDPTLGQIRGWVFDSQGGFAEEFWYPAGTDQWVIKSTGVSAHGERVSATHLLTHTSNHNARLLVLDHAIDGEAQLTGEQHQITRPPAEPAK